MPFCPVSCDGKNFVVTFAICYKFVFDNLFEMKDNKKKVQEEPENEVNIPRDEETAEVPVQENGGEHKEHHTAHKHHDKSWEEKYEEQKDKYLRLAAEFDNYRKRSARERLELVSVAAEETIKGLLPVVDDMERAIKTLRDSGADPVIIEGEELIYKKMFDYLKSKGLSLIETAGKELDTDFHEAVAQFPAPEEKLKNKIIDVVVNGYTLNGKVIRFAQVVVGI